MKKQKCLFVSLVFAIFMALGSAGATPPEGQSQPPETSGSHDAFVTSRFNDNRGTVAAGEASGFIANDHHGNLASAFSRSVRDPLTYVPAAAVGLASSLDWASSQRYLRQGWLETNPGFTSSGLRNAAPVDAAAGYQRIVTREVLPMLATSIAINTFSYWLEQKGMGRLARVLRWTSAGAMTAASARSFRQFHRNQAGSP